MRTILEICLVTLMMLVSATAAEKPTTNKVKELAPLKQLYKRPNYIKFPKNAPYSPRIAALGKLLFFDPRLSKSQNMSCATCHNPSFGWETPVDKAIGSLNVPLQRHAPTLLNLADAQQFYWDGRARSLEEQAEGPITHVAEMGNNFSDLIVRLKGIARYENWFVELFPGEGITKQNILTAIATYERTIQSGIAPFDSWIDGKADAIPESAIKGFELFNGKAGCANCHVGWNFTKHSMHDIGLPIRASSSKMLSESKYQYYTFKTPGLRNITTRAPYMHNGSLKTLEDVIDHYAKGGVYRRTKSELINAFAITQLEKDALVSFLATLTDNNLNVSAPILPAN